ncbi:hypothetical protein FACS1894108_05600 [Planctomycetales bacterium]|nr:hypothetical protein FACS1894108_05600 [Planctomycetales bacterium]
MFYLLLVLLTLLFSGFFSALETSMYSANHLRLLEADRAGDPAAKRAVRILKDVPFALATVLVGNNIANGLGTQFFSYYLLDAGVRDCELVTMLVVVPLFFFFGETLPKQYAYRHADGMLLRSQGVFGWMQTALYPVAALLNLLGRWLRAFLAKSGWQTVKAEGRAAVRENIENFYREGYLTPAQKAMTAKIMQIEDRRVGAVMQPLDAAPVIAEDTPAFVAGQTIMRGGGKQALLVNRDKQCTGKMVALNSLIAAERGAAVKNYARGILRFDARAPVGVALHKMRANGAGLALVEKNNRVVGAVSINRLVGCVITGIEKNAGWE